MGGWEGLKDRLRRRRPEPREAPPPVLVYSPLREALLAAAARAGADPSRPRLVVHAVLTELAALLPEAERRHLMVHLPADVRALIDMPRPSTRPARTAADFVSHVVASSDLSIADHGEAIVRAVLVELWMQVPEEAVGVTAVLPESIRDLWRDVPLRREL